ncbi:serine/threonine-protein phosphatase [Streptomyces sp. SID13666]|uniref:PP2C family protein-serine/threonine phosphatase n=1 Tax=unclassified Streptomyces TaxID=2593676 RepID=UPI0013BFFD88|nr:MULTISPECIES: PP2C family protein-serine/threonine phosphatase [unclassified Streptomyces]NEA56662.1 serine/threonine-protein phosphatase [Streptomyces sp. SID13666]NEA73106.1 serine/threonine-protein phosphatase [Streptomyces sp. SID13588]
MTATEVPRAGEADGFAVLPVPRQRQDASVPALTLLVIGDDPAGTFTAPELFDGGGNRVRIRRARNLTEAERLLTDDVHCVLLVLDGDGLESLRRLLRLAPTTAVLVLTGEGAGEVGEPGEAVRIGAQDHLSRDELDGSHLTRAIRYAVERKRADLAQRQLTETRLLAQENSRLERGLLPTPLLEGADLRFAARYRPGRSRALLGGDFYDTVRTSDGTVHAMIGDVCGHGPDAAALGVELRIAWRALTFAGLSGDLLLSTLQKVLENERADDEIFATLCTLDIAPDGGRADLYLAGHPAPLLTGADGVPRLLPYEAGGPALGLLPQAAWSRIEVELGASWSLMLYTDGLIEGRIGQGTQRLGQDGMVGMITRQLAGGLRGEDLLDAAVTEARELNGGELTDDVAVVLLDRVAPARILGLPAQIQRSSG